MTKKINIGDNTVKVHREGHIQTSTTIDGHEITDEFYPFVANTVELVVDEEVAILPNSFKKGVIPL